MFRKDAQLLRQTSLDFQAADGDIVRIANVFSRIKNWWKSKFDSDFARNQETVGEAYEDIKGPMGELRKNLEELDAGFKSQDPEQVQKVVEKTPEVIEQVTSEMKKLKEKIEDYDAHVTKTLVEQNGYVHKDYEKNPEEKQAMWKMLPEEFRNEIPIEQPINQPLSEFDWYKDFTPEDLRITEEAAKGVRRELKKGLMTDLRFFITEEEINEIIASGFPVFLRNLQEEIVNQSTLVQVNFGQASKKIERRITNQMQVFVNPGNVVLPYKEGLDIIVSIPHANFVRSLHTSTWKKKEVGASFYWNGFH